MSSSSSKSSNRRRNSILKVRQTTTTVDTTVDVVEQPKNRRRVSFHHQKTVKEYDKEKHELSATSPLKETVKEAMSDFDSTKSNSTMMSLGTPDRTTGENNTMMLFRGMMSGGEPSSIHHETKDMSFSIIEDPASYSDEQNDTLNVFKGLGTSHMSIHSKTVDISYRMEESVNENPADDTMNIFGKPSANQSTRTMGNMTMEMDISKADNTLTDGAFEGDDTMAIFGSVAKKKDTTIPLDNTMDIFTATSGSSDKSCMSQSLMMDMSVNPSPVNSQDLTMGIFGKGSQGSQIQADESVAMEEATMVVEMDEKKEEEEEIVPSMSSIHQLDTTQSKRLNESHSPTLDDTMGIFGLAKAQEAGDDDIGMDISMAIRPVSAMNGDGSPTMNIFKRKGNEEEEQTMNVFPSKRWKEDGDTCMGENGDEGPSKEEKEVGETREGSQKCVYMDEVDATMNIFGVKMDDTMKMSVTMEEKKEEEEETEREERDEKKEIESIMEISTRTAVEGSSEKVTISPLHNSDGDRTLDVFNGVEERSQMDVTGTGNSTFSLVKSGGDSSQMDMTGEENETFGIFGKKDDEVEEEEEQDGTIQDEKKEEEMEEEKITEETPHINQSIVDDNSIPDGNGSADMEDVTPPSQFPLFNGERRKTRLSTVIEVSSHYTVSSSQSMRDRVESTDDETKEEGILDGIEEEKEKEEKENEESMDEREEEKQLEMEEQKEDSERMEEESMVESASPSGNNITFSTPFTKRSMLDETRLSDRSILNITRSFEDIVLEKIEWMRKEKEEGEMNEILKVEEKEFQLKTNEAIERSESKVEGLLSDIAQLKNGDLIAKSIMKLNSSKVPEHRLIFEWARREAQREWWEERAEKAEKVNEELERRMKEDEEDLKQAKDDLIMMNKLNELKEDVESMEKEVEVGRGMNRNTIDELIGASKKKEEDKERLQREVNRMELERIKESNNILKIMTERCNAVDESIKRKMEEREKNKRELRAYLGLLTNNLK